MKVVVIGSGLIGVTTAYFLRRRGHEVTVLDREEGPGLETSFANAALLTPSMAEPWNTPGSWRVLLSSLGRPDAAMQLRLRALPALLGWGVTFLRNSNPAAFERNTLNNLRLALHSLEAMESLWQQTGIEGARSAGGTLRIFRDHATLNRASKAAHRLIAEGIRFRRLSRVETVALEPALAPISDQLTGALHYETDETSDAYRFCVSLADHARQHGVEFCFHTEVSSLEVRVGQVTAVLCDRKRFVADRYIVAAGSYSSPLLRRAGVHLPVRPVKGYSVTFDCPRPESSLHIPIVDDHFHAVITPLEGAIRVAGTAEFAGYDLALTPARIRNLLRFLHEVLPQAPVDPATARPWCGLRAMSVDGVPIISPTRIKNLWVNTGHGHLGWTMAAGSAQLLSDLMSGDSPPIDPTPYALVRFGSAH
jgi:D-amino-acid dehydrogenase